MELRTFLLGNLLISMILRIRHKKDNVWFSQQTGRKASKRRAKLIEAKFNGKSRMRRQRSRANQKARWAQLSTEEKENILQYRREQKAAQESRLAKAQENGLRVCIDLRLADQMHERERGSLARQLLRVWGTNRKALKPLALRLTSCNGIFRDTLMDMGMNGWHAVVCSPKPVETLYPTNQMVYLSPDSENILTHIHQDHIYVIGGIVDRPVKKDISKTIAIRCGMKHARLPITEHLTIKQQKSCVLNVNTVVEILCDFLEHGDWKSALSKAIPLRVQSS